MAIQIHIRDFVMYHIPSGQLAWDNCIAFKGLVHRFRIFKRMAFYLFTNKSITCSVVFTDYNSLKKVDERLLSSPGFDPGTSGSKSEHATNEPYRLSCIRTKHSRYNSTPRIFQLIKEKRYNRFNILPIKYYHDQLRN